MGLYSPTVGCLTTLEGSLKFMKAKVVGITYLLWHGRCWLSRLYFLGLRLSCRLRCLCSLSLHRRCWCSSWVTLYSRLRSGSFSPVWFVLVCGRLSHFVTTFTTLCRLVWLVAVTTRTMSHKICITNYYYSSFS